MSERFDLRVEGHIEALKSVVSQRDELDGICRRISECFAGGRGRKVMVCGNGGSSCEATHLVEELMGRYKKERGPYTALCLNDSTALMTCIGNDFGFEEVFSRQVQALGGGGDVLIVFSTSGNSKNIVKAAKEANKAGMKVLGFLGGDGGEVRSWCDHSVVVNSFDSAYIQEAHQFMLHWVCEFLENGCE
jgi:D-sedoheptulose 7-phosphate isomerase